MLSFMDAFSGYNQIQMYGPDIPKTSFVTDQWLFCYEVMPFGLKNAGATYQCLVNKIFAEQIGKNMEVYVDGMLVKSLKAQDHIADLEEAFAVLRRNRMKLNPAKCAFGVTTGKFLGFMEIENFAFAVVISARKLRPYFQAHHVTVLTDQPLWKILQKPDTSGRLINWAVELGKFDIQIKPRSAIKSQYALRLDFKASNNEAEYEALIAGIALAIELRVSRIRVHNDSQLVVSQVNGFSEAKEERMIKYLEKGLKKRAENARGLWADELLNLLWAYRTTPRTTTGELPFSLAFGVDAVIPIEIGAHSPRLEAYNERANPNHLRSSLDLVEETREKARVKMATYQHRVARYYNSRMKERAVRTGDLVLRQSEVYYPRNSGKLAPTWEGPYRVSRTLQLGSYQLEDLEGNPIPRTWHIPNLKKFYQ
ncbi:uncharacterized protein LOC143861280 [Tasmannia lanceolata]|uniref:uncharacterized protein LOC143861280 n=1 Tax=Tasmannia lanceolata TaxID=3420 RepID=UPI004063745A